MSRPTLDQRAAWWCADRCNARIPKAYQWGSLDSGGALDTALSHVSPSPIDAACAWLDGEKTVLLIRGETHSLKSTLAAACVRDRTEQNRHAAMVFCGNLSPDAPADVREDANRTVRNANGLLVLNDLGKSLGGAPVDSGLAAQRRAEVSRVIHDLSERRVKLIVTTTLEDRRARGIAGILETFGEDILARLTDSRVATEIRLWRAT